MFETLFLQIEEQQCIRRSATWWAQRVDTQVDWPNSFWDMTKCLKPYFGKLKKQQCIRRSATCWAQRVDTQVDWPNSFWDMTKCLKPYFCKLKKQQCIRVCWARRSANCWDMTKANALTLRTIGPIVSTTRLRYDKMFKSLFWQIEETNSVFGAALPAEHNALTLRSIGPIVSEIWQNV